MLILLMIGINTLMVSNSVFAAECHKCINEEAEEMQLKTQKESKEQIHDNYSFEELVRTYQGYNESRELEKRLEEELLPFISISKKGILKLKVMDVILIFRMAV